MVGITGTTIVGVAGTTAFGAGTTGGGYGPLFVSPPGGLGGGS